MAEYRPQEIEKKWQDCWEQHQTFKVAAFTDRPKYYVLDMFPYPSGAGLHVGHPLGYIATDIVARYKRHKGFHVLHPAGFDAFGLPAEQYAIQTGQHPAITTARNIATYKEQMRKLGFNYDWSREVQTCAPEYYRWTQWIFIQIFHSWYDQELQKARPIAELEKIFSEKGNISVKAVCDEDTAAFSSEEWKQMQDADRQKLLLKYRLAYLAETTVNWCPALGTVLSNDEVKDGFSERGGHPVERKNMLQWMMRITAYADRLLAGLDTLDWPEPVKEIQRNWIGKSFGAQFGFSVKGFDHVGKISVFTTRPDTLFGVTFVTLAPEHPLVNQITTGDQRQAVEDYVIKAKNRSERDRMSDVKTISGVFTGAYVLHPFTGAEIPVWVGDYVLAGYGTGAVMAVPAHDSRDHAFALHFGIPIKQVINPEQAWDFSKAAWDQKSGVLINSDFLDGLQVYDAIQACISKLESSNLGSGLTNFRLRDAIFTRQRYWGEPLPIFFKEGVPYTLPESELPLQLPEVDKYLPTEDGAPPLGRATHWNYEPGKGIVENGLGYPLELSTMPGWAGSSWYWFRYMDAQNATDFASRDALNYWGAVDLYMGGAEHATGHLLYSRFWCKILYDLGHVPIDEPFTKLINQGMIQGVSAILKDNKKAKILLSDSVSLEHLDQQGYNPEEFYPQNIDIRLIDKSGYISVKDLIQWRSDYQNYQIIYGTDEEKESSKILTSALVEKMSKSKYNVVNPDDICATYGADTLRLYEMFLGPLEQSKPWNTHGIDGVQRFLRKLWNLFHDDQDNFFVSDSEPSSDELKVLHKTIKKIEEDMERFSFNTSVSSFMICVNELQSLKCNKRKILEPLVILISPFAPHLAEELWSHLGNSETVSEASFPTFNSEYLIESVFTYPVSVNGKHRANIELPLNMPAKEMEETALAHPAVQKWTEGKAPKKVIVVPGRIINIVV